MKEEKEEPSKKFGKNREECSKGDKTILKSSWVESPVYRTLCAECAKTGGEPIPFPARFPVYGLCQRHLP